MNSLLLKMIQFFDPENPPVIVPTRRGWGKPLPRSPKRHDAPKPKLHGRMPSWVVLDDLAHLGDKERKDSDQM